MYLYFYPSTRSGAAYWISYDPCPAEGWDCQDGMPGDFTRVGIYSCTAFYSKILVQLHKL